MVQYKVVLESQLGPREGMLRLKEQDGVLTGVIILLGYENPVSGEWTGGHSIRLSHHLHTQISDLSCVSVFELDGDTIILVMFVLPQILLIGGKVVDKTSFSMPNVSKKHASHGRVKVDGIVRGEIHGIVSGTMHATVDGEVDLNLISGSAFEEGDEDKTE